MALPLNNNNIYIYIIYLGERQGVAPIWRSWRYHSATWRYLGAHVGAN